MSNPSGISVIIPCYNAGLYLRESVKSVLDQNFDPEHFEVIVIDDKSDDSETLNVLGQLENLNQSVRVVRHTLDDNKGPSAARNTGLRNAKHDLILPVDADDKLVTVKGDAGYLHQIFELFSSDDELDIAYSKIRLFGALDAPFHVTDYQERLMLVTNLLHVCAGYRKDFALSAGGYDEDICGAEDYLFWINLLNENYKQGKETKVRLIDDELYLYRQHDHDLNVDASHGKSYKELMEIVTSRNPEIYQSHFNRVAQDQLPDFLVKQMKRIIKKHPYEGEPDAKAWVNAYLDRYQLT